MSDLLPPNATAQERALSLAVARAGSVPVVIRDLYNPATCPESLLPWLAWALHIDRWDAGWTENQKRNVIAASFVTHSKKGTADAVRTVANAFGTEVVIREWFEQTPAGAPYTFTATFSIPTADAAQQTSIIEAIRDVKPVRSEMTAQVVQTSLAPAAVLCFGRLASFNRSTATLN